MIGKTILGYTIKEEIATGGFGTVYKCEKMNQAGTYVRALKYISLPTKKQYHDILNSMGGDYAKANDYFASSLQDIVGEIQILNYLTEISTKNVVSYYENQIDEQQSPLKYDIYILMEYLTSFPDYLQKNDVSVRDVIRLGKDILMALDACHSNQIVHRDIKDDNIFVGHDGIFKLGDFGVSKKLQDRFGAESVKGTLSYIAPEVYLKKEEYDYTVDLYSLGIVLYKLLNGNRIPFLPPFPEPYNSVDEEQAFEKRMNYKIPEFPINAKNKLGQIILKAIAKRDGRYNSAKEFYVDLCEVEKCMPNEQLNQMVIYRRENEKEIRGFLEDQGTSGSEGYRIHQRNSSSNFLEETVGVFGGVLDGDTETAGGEKSVDFCGESDNVKGNRHQEKIEKQEFTKVNGDVEEISRNGKIDLRVEEEELDLNVDMERSFHTEFVQENHSLGSEPAQVIQKKSSDVIFYLLPAVIAFAYIFIYMVYLPHVYDKVISIEDWIVKNPKAVIEDMQSFQNIVPSLYKITFWKILNYVFYVGFVASLYFLGRKLQFSKPAQASNAVLKDKEAYYSVMEIYEEIKQIPSVRKDVYNAVKIVHDRLKNESDFGYGSEQVIQCENEIEQQLSKISLSLVRLYNQDTVNLAEQDILSACYRIMTKLKIRMELKKK